MFKLKAVDNSGRGNCMYYAYSLSLMYYLTALDRPNSIIDNVFTQLKLPSDECSQLKEILFRPFKGVFSKKDTAAIERILGVKTRALAASRSVLEFSTNYKATALYSAASYGLRHTIKAALLHIKSEYANAVEIYSDPSGNYTNADIYKVNGMQGAMIFFAYNSATAINAQFIRSLNKKYPATDEKRYDSFFQTQVMDSVIDIYVNKFFTDNDNHYLMQYSKFINTSGNWGSEEILGALHRAVTGEYAERSEDGLIQIKHQVNISLEIHSANKPLNPASADIILMNIENLHWVSYIPPHIINKYLTPRTSLLLAASVTLKMLREQVNKFVEAVENSSLLEEEKNDLYQLTEEFIANPDENFENFEQKTQSFNNFSEITAGLLGTGVAAILIATVASQLSPRHGESIPLQLVKKAGILAVGVGVTSAVVGFFKHPSTDQTNNIAESMSSLTRSLM